MKFYNIYYSYILFNKIISSSSFIDKNNLKCNSDKEPINSMCYGCPPMFNGKPCASTTRYYDIVKGACGCSVPPYYRENPINTWWTFTQYTAALNCANNNPLNPSLSWCPLNCGQCYKLCTTGGNINNDILVKPNICKIFKITNNCADGYPYEPTKYQNDWCSQNISFLECLNNPYKCQSKGYTNMYGYPAHFDLMDLHNQITNLGWDNPEVTFEQISCLNFIGPIWNCQCNQYT